MSILTKKEILKEIKKGILKIKPFSQEQVGPASIDLTLDDKFRLYTKSIKKIQLDKKIEISKITRLVDGKSIVLKPRQAILGITIEKITLPENICGWLTGRSSFARIGLAVHTTASFVQPGVSNKQVLEISNIGPFNLVLHKGIRICQLVLERAEGKARYEGKYSKQDNL
ncbi:dCTP deaminase [Candidatus Woesearchaeota archaeon]|nr:dCTP deaminase [Candidatus Woesearchaeota archaeon]